MLYIIIYHNIFLVINNETEIMFNHYFIRIALMCLIENIK